MIKRGILAIVGLILTLLFQACTNGFSSSMEYRSHLMGDIGSNPNPSSAVCTRLPCSATRVAKPLFKTEAILFEDNFIFKPATGVTDLIYRVEGAPSIDRQTAANGGSLHFSGTGGLVHAGQLSRATLRVRLTIANGEPEIAFAHNGLSDRNSNANPNPGFKIVLRPESTDIVDIKTGVTLVALNEAVPRKIETELSVAWDVSERSLRVDLPRASYAATLMTALPYGGFALRSSMVSTSYTVKKVQTLWQDNRRLLHYDEYDTIRNLDGTVAQVIPSAKLPAGMTAYATVLLDLRKMRSLILFGGNDLNFNDFSTIKGFAVRDLPSGDLLDVFPAPYNGCMLMQGGGGLDGYALVQSWNSPASLCWVDWNAYDRGDKVGFVKLAATYQAIGMAGSSYVGFHDPDSALDGSIIRYLRITEAFRGVTHIAVHPNIAAFASFTEQTVPQDIEHSHTGAGGAPSGLSVRDKDRAIYEVWAYTTTRLHIQNRGYNLFSNSDDWAGPRFTSSLTDAPYQDYANLMPSLTMPGKYWAPLITWTPAAYGVEGQRVHFLSLGANALISEANVSPLPIPSHTPSQILWP